MTTGKGHYRTPPTPAVSAVLGARGCLWRVVLNSGTESSCCKGKAEVSRSPQHFGSCLRCFWKSHGDTPEGSGESCGPGCSCSLLGPAPSIDEQLQPGGGGKSIEGRGSPCPLPEPHSPLRVWHECQMAAILGADASYASWRPIGVQGVLLCGIAIIVCPVQRNQTPGFDLGLEFRRGKRHVTFSMGTPHRQHRALHPLKHHGGPGLHAHGGPPGLVSPRQIVAEQEAWLYWLAVVA